MKVKNNYYILRQMMMTTNPVLKPPETKTINYTSNFSSGNENKNANQHTLLFSIFLFSLHFLMHI